jgi:hypothetical protein
VAVTHHLEILPFDPKTGLLIPEMEGSLTLLDESGEEVDSRPLQLYLGRFYHYANNLSIPESGIYTLRAKLEPPQSNRHGSEEAEGSVRGRRDKKGAVRLLLAENGALPLIRRF